MMPSIHVVDLQHADPTVSVIFATSAGSHIRPLPGSRQTHGGKYYGHAEGPLVTRDGAYIGGLPELLAVAASDFNFTEAVSPESYKVSKPGFTRYRLQT